MESLKENEGDDEYDMQYIATQLTELCKEYVDVSNQITELQSKRKELTQLQKEHATRITSYMQMCDVDEVNCGAKHKILIQDKKSTTGMKINDIATIIQSKSIDQSLKEQMINEIKNSRVTTLKPTIKLKII